MGIYAGVSAENRRAGRRARLLDAGLDAIGGGGVEALTVRGVCERAGLTARYFYESFGDREALVVAVFDAVAAEAAAAVLDAVAGAGETAEEKARAAIAAFVDLVAGDPRKARVLFVEAPSSEALTRRRGETLEMFAGLIAAHGREFYEVPSGEDALIATAARMLAGGLAQTLLAWVDGSLPTTRDALIGDCAALFVAAGEAAVARARQR